MVVSDTELTKTRWNQSVEETEGNREVFLLKWVEAGHLVEIQLLFDS